MGDQSDPYMSSMLEAELRRAANVVAWTRAKVSGINLQLDMRGRLSAICFGVVQDHSEAIFRLIGHDEPLPSTALALVRPTYEAYVRGLWLSGPATDEQVMRYANDTHVPKMPKLLESLSAATRTQKLQRIYDNGWDAMCNFTHAGAEHAMRWAQGPVLEPAYDPHELSRVLQFASRLSVLAAAGLVKLSAGGEQATLALLREGQDLLGPLPTPSTVE